jgi:hypothetical protein
MAMPIWTPAPITDEPEIRLLRWRILETADGTRHFVGCDERNFTGRVSSNVHFFDHERRVGTTCSGRSYQLVGPVGWSDAAQYVWEYWCKVNEVVSYVDVTARCLLESRDDDAQTAN